MISFLGILQIAEARTVRHPAYHHPPPWRRHGEATLHVEAESNEEKGFTERPPFTCLLNGYHWTNIVYV